jgi:siroheme decarboxylase
MNKLEEQILNLIQHQFPITPDPYGDIGKIVSCTREEAFAVVTKLHKSGIIRRLGGSFSAKGMGYDSTLVGAKVVPAKLESVAKVAGSFMEVTHNYERSSDYNLWFTVIAASSERLDSILNTVREQDGVEALHKLPAEKLYKLKVDFKFNHGNS